ncbi:sn-glycerol-3-phosphate ABC transporter ATP-binding protein UgpC [Niveibacterium umoris]|uniref:Multiple sugar transport system ATP-binding protein n=1 Tax=Niveibacterium umoris TaxID=1193620 RepID=A0A840BIG1_9RHOO|nr:sn-glycerol-3-phosphate ABC transporter ATP-binding protein UgpC [Niveibacterium umoris]MBB4010716.1 multiple sugar transport system ATP-binding protein [Niveibacterium umoris]
MGALSIRNVRKAFNQTEVLKGIDIEIAKGEFLILVGPSGCGKSTLLNLIAGLDNITSGDILIDDRVVNHLSPKDRDIAMVFQSYALYPNMTVRQNIAFGLEMRKIPPAERQASVDRVAQILQIGHLLDRRPSQLSGGQRQRVAMGRAIARNPALFLFDEPLSNLDAKLRVEMRTEIKMLHHRLGTTIVYVTHDQVEAMTLGDKIAVMNAGSVQQFGTPHQLYDDPANLFVAGFMGSPSMNFINARVEDTGDGGCGLRLESDGQTFIFPAFNQTGGLRKYVGKEIVFGIRPEQITHVPPGLGDLPNLRRVSLKVHLDEPTGPDTLVLVLINGGKVTCRVHPEFARPAGEMLDLQFDLSKAVYFDPDTQERIR